MTLIAKTARILAIGTAALLIHADFTKAQPQPRGYPGSGNFRAAPNLANQATFNAGATSGAQAGLAAGFRQGQLNSAYYGPSYYGPYSDPLGGFTSGIADCVSAWGNTLIQEQQARALQEQNKQMKIDTRRKNFDEYLYERDAAPTVEDDRERQRIENVRRSRNDPPRNEIVSGIALNTLLGALQKMHAQHVRGPTVLIDESTRTHLNLTSGETTGSVGLLRNGGKLQWPAALQEDIFAADRKRLDELTPLAYKQAESGPVQGAVLREMKDAVKNIHATISRNIAEITPGDYSKAKSYLRQIEGAINALQDPNVSNFVSRKWSVQAGTVGDMVVQLTQQGLKFAPATPGDEPAYMAIHSGMVEYYSLPSRPWDPTAK
jgi:hypothetical protein